MGDEMSGADRTPRSAAVAEAASVASTGKLMCRIHLKPGLKKEIVRPEARTAGRGGGGARQRRKKRQGRERREWDDCEN